MMPAQGYAAVDRTAKRITHRRWRMPGWLRGPWGGVVVVLGIAALVAVGNAVMGGVR